MNKSGDLRRAFIFSFVVACLAACDHALDQQPKFKAFEATSFFADGASARPFVKGTIPRNFKPLVRIQDIDLATDTVLKRGRERYEIYCSACHGYSGFGDGMAVQRGFPAPPSYHSDFLRAQPLEHFYGVITDGQGLMASYASRVSSDDRWAIAAYIRVLQLSQDFSMKFKQ